MSETRQALHTGGCQCGAVRYALYAEPTNPHVCHCRMCQKAFGAYFAPLAGVPPKDFAWVKGMPGVFRSSQAAERGFCRDCGTPLFFHYVGGEHISLTIGSFDAPHRIAIRYQMGMEGKHPSLADIDAIEDCGTTESEDAEAAAAIAGCNRQHPDHDTAVWPPE